MMIQNVPKCPSNLIREKWWDSVAHLDLLLSLSAVEEIIVRERLETGHFPHGETPALTWIGMDVVVAVLGNVAHYRGAWVIG